MAVEISVIIPTYNRAGSLAGCLQSVFSQDYPREELEIIVVDDGSVDNTAGVVDKLRNTNSNLYYFKQKHKGPASARNQGIEKSRGRIVAFIDDDCLVDKTWAASITAAYKNDPGLDIVGGITLLWAEKNWLKVSQFLSDSTIKTYVGGKKQIIFFPTCNVAIKKEICQKNKFNQDINLPGGEDLEYFWRLFKAGYKFGQEKEAKVVHCREEKIISFIRQAYIYGRGNLLAQAVHQDHPLLKDLKTGTFSFWRSALANIIKIPRFGFSLAKSFIKKKGERNKAVIFRIYLYLILHRIFYIAGNINQFIRGRKKWFPVLNLPRLVIIEATRRCNLSCRICRVWKTFPQEKDPAGPDIKRILGQVHESGVKEIAFSGAEPLLRPDIFEILDYARGIGVKNLGILTNGILVKDLLPGLKPFLLDNTIMLAVSLDSLVEARHNYIRNSEKAWSGTIESLKELSRLKKKNKEVNFGIISVIVGQNAGELPALAKFARSLDANWFQVQPFLPNNLNLTQRSKNRFWVAEERFDLLNKSLNELIAFARGNRQFIRNSPANLGLIKNYYSRSLPPGQVSCVSADKTIMISLQGQCLTCFSNYGDLKKETFEDIINSGRRLRAIQRVKKCKHPCLLPCTCDMDNIQCF